MTTDKIKQRLRELKDVRCGYVAATMNRSFAERIIRLLRTDLTKRKE